MTEKTKKVAIVMGSKSDEAVMKPAADMLEFFSVGYDIKVTSAHRMPNKTKQFIIDSESNGIEIFIAGAGKAAHLPGVIASYTACPVIGVPVKTEDLGGLDSLLSIVQMPPGVPVATVAINGAKNAAVLAVQILALKYKEIAAKLAAYKKSLEEN